MKYLVLCGCYRSGTTAVSEILSSHSELFFTSELYLFNNTGLINNRLKKLLNKKGYNAGLKNSVYNNLLSSTDKFIKSTINNPINNLKQYEKRINRFYKKDYKYIGDKVPEYIFQLLRIKTEIKNVKIIYLIRDGRDVIESQVRGYYRKIKKGHNPNKHFWCARDIDLAIAKHRNWLYYMWVWNRIKKGLNISYFELYYRDLVKNQEKTIKRLAKYLKVDEKELIKVFLNKFKPTNYQSWKNKEKRYSKLPEDWKHCLKDYGFEIK